MYSLVARIVANTLNILLYFLLIYPKLSPSQSLLPIGSSLSYTLHQHIPGRYNLGRLSIEGRKEIVSKEIS